MLPQSGTYSIRSVSNNFAAFLSNRRRTARRNNLLIETRVGNCDITAIANDRCWSSDKGCCCYNVVTTLSRVFAQSQSISIDALSSSAERFAIGCPLLQGRSLRAAKSCLSNTELLEWEWLLQLNCDVFVLDCFVT